MNLNQIIATRPEIKKAIYDRFPITKAERKGCQSEKAQMDIARLAMAKKLIAHQPKQEYGS